jgi:enterobactin synthetase component D
VKPFHIAYQHATRHGIVAAIHLPTEPEPVAPAVWERLHPREVDHAHTLTGLRQVSFVGGRLAARLAAQQLGVTPGPILPDDLGAPTLPDGLVGSISHKRSLAVALVGRNFGETVGVDLEEYGPPRLGIAPRVLTAAELAALEGLPDDRRWIALLVRFSLKESLYKALSPWVRRYVGFHEAEIAPDTDGGAAVSLALSGGEGPFEADAAYAWLHGRLLTSVRLRPVSALEPVEPASDQR